MEILFVYPKSLGLRSYIKKDLDILTSKHEVTLYPFDRLRFEIPTLAYKVLKSELVFNWFCGLHALVANLFSKILLKPSITVVGGYEVAKLPENDYGQFANNRHRFITIWGLKLSDIVLNVSRYSQKSTIANARISADKCKVIYHGFSEDVFFRNHNIKKKDIVLTIAYINNVTLVRKGIELFVKSAKFLPDIEFMLVGPDLDGTVDRLKKISTPNVRFAGGLFGHELANACNQAKVYVQLSCHESFGCSVAEAMLCGCVPVVANNSALPEVVGDTGFFMENRTPEEIAQKIKLVLETFHAKEHEAITRIKTKFPLNLRKKMLLESIDSLTKS